MFIKIDTDLRCPYCDSSENSSYKWNFEEEGDIEIVCDYCENILLKLELMD